MALQYPSTPLCATTHRRHAGGVASQQRQRTARHPGNCICMRPFLHTDQPCNLCTTTCTLGGAYRRYFNEAFLAHSCARLTLQPAYCHLYTRWCVWQGVMAGGMPVKPHLRAARGEAFLTGWDPCCLHSTMHKIQKWSSTVYVMCIYPPFHPS